MTHHRCPTFAPMLAAMFLLAIAPSICMAANPPSAATVECSLGIGVTPEALIVAEVSSAEAAQILARLADASELTSILAAARVSFDAASSQCTIAAEALAQNPTDPAIVEASAAAVSARAAAATAVSSAKDALFAAATQDIAAAKSAALAMFGAAATKRVPDEFRATARSDEQWTAIERALRAESRALREGSSLGESNATLLAEVRSETAVAAAKARLDSELTAMNAVFVPAN